MLLLCAGAFHSHNDAKYYVKMFKNLARQPGTTSRTQDDNTTEQALNTMGAGAVPLSAQPTPRRHCVTYSVIRTLKPTCPLLFILSSVPDLNDSVGVEQVRVNINQDKILVREDCQLGSSLKVGNVTVYFWQVIGKWQGSFGVTSFSSSSHIVFTKSLTPPSILSLSLACKAKLLTRLYPSTVLTRVGYHRDSRTCTK